MSSSTRITRLIEVEHVRIESAKSVDEVRTALEAIVPQRDATVSDALAQGDKERVEDERQHGPKLALFLTRGMDAYWRFTAMHARLTSTKLAIRSQRPV